MSTVLPRGEFSDSQRGVLLQPIQPHRVHYLDGQSHLAAWDVIAHLNRVFGFEGWDKEILSLDVLYAHTGEKSSKDGSRTWPVFSVGYRCTLRLTIRDTNGTVVRVVEDAATGTAKNQRDMGDAHDLAIKSAVSYALKRCAKDLGDQFGLSLYNKGQETACVQVVWPYGAGGDQPQNTVEADGLHEGDDGFGASRGEDTPATEVPPVREPAPARPAKPEPTPPPEKTPAPELSEDQQKEWAKRITDATTVSEVRGMWEVAKGEGLLDALVLDMKTETMKAVRELLTRRVSEIEVGAA